MEYSKELNNNICFLKPESEKLDLFNKKYLEEMFLSEMHHSRIIALDLEKVNSIDSSVLGVILKISKKFSEEDKKMVICNVSSIVLGILNLTRMEYLIPVSKSRDDVVQKYGADSF